MVQTFSDSSYIIVQGSVHPIKYYKNRTTTTKDGEVPTPLPGQSKKVLDNIMGALGTIGDVWKGMKSKYQEGYKIQGILVLILCMHQ